MNRTDFLKRLKIASYMTPHLMIYPSGSRYAVFPGSAPGEGYYQVDDDVTQEDVLSVWIKPEPSQKKTSNTPNQEWSVDGSKGSVYTVSLKNENFLCSCMGFSFRRKCKHIDTVKNSIQKCK